PLLALERVASVTSDLLVLETHVERIPVRRPAMVFFPGTELEADQSNWWGPNEAALVAMLKDVGFRDVRVVRRRWRFMAGPRAAWRLARAGRQRLPNPWVYATQDRLIAHARR